MFERFVEPLAEYAHNAWGGWMQYLFSKGATHKSGAVIIPADLVERWKRQMQTPYGLLPEEEKLSDREEANKIIEVFAKGILEDPGTAALLGSSLEE